MRMLNPNLHKIIVFLIFIFTCIFSCRKEEIYRVPNVLTTTVSEVTSTTAKAVGELTDLGEGIDDHGHCWGFNTRPTIEDNKNSLGTVSSIGLYTSFIEELWPGNTYYLRAYVRKNQEVYYGNEIAFITKTAGIPVLTTNIASSVTQTTAISGGNIIVDGGIIIARGVCWGTSKYPTIESNKTWDGPGIGTFSSTLEGLSPNTIYYIRAYATNSIGTGYGNQISFSTLMEGTVCDMDNNSYNLVKIGTQVWMAENLKTTKYNDGTSITNAPNNSTWANISSPAYSWFNNDSNTYKNKYGALYNWYAVNTDKLCPVGWHVPNDMEWTTLVNFLGGYSNAGGKLKEAGLNHWASPNTGANNETGFSALPGGYRYSHDGSFSYSGRYGMWWSNTESGVSFALGREMYYNSGSVSNNYQTYDKKSGFSVRCLRDY